MATLNYGDEPSALQVRARRNPLTSSSSSSATPSTSSVTSVNQASDRAPAKSKIKTLFKKLCRKYLKTQTPPTDKEMEPLWEMREYIDFEDVVVWRDEVGVKKGLVYENGRVLFNEWPVRPHENIIAEFNSQFDRQYVSPYAGTAHYPVFTNDGTQDVRIPGAGRNQQPDVAWRPINRPQAPLPNALVPLFPRQPNGDPYPSLVMEVGNTQSIPELLGIRDRMLSWRTAVNVFVLVSYNRNATRASDSWYVQISIRDYLAPQPPPGTGANYPVCIVEYETPKLGPRYPKVNNNLAQGTDIYYLNTTDLYHPETPPILNPPLPATFQIDLEAIRAIIIATRRP